MCLDIQTRKWTVHKNTLRNHDSPGCLITKGHLYVFSGWGGVERRLTNDEY